MEGYPKIKYPMRGSGSITVDSPEQEKQLGANWLDYRMPQEEAPKPAKKARAAHAEEVA